MLQNNRPSFGGFNRTQQFNSPIRIFSPGVFRRSAARPIAVRTGEDRNDVLMVLDLRALHTVSGHVDSSNPGQAIASGRVSLTDTADSSLSVLGSIEPDGSFTLRYVPSGSFTLQVFGASTRAFGAYRGRMEDDTSTSGVSFQPASQPVTVTDTDLTGLAITLTPTQTQTQSQTQTR